MANTYTYHGTGERWVVEQATAKDRLDVARENADYLYEALTAMTDPDEADGTIFCSIESPFHWQVEDTGPTIWSIGWWQSSNGQWWLLGRTANVTSFTRSDANFYIPQGDINDVPDS